MAGEALEGATRTTCEVIQFDAYLAGDDIPAGFTTSSERIARLSKDERKRAALEDARRWLADRLPRLEGERTIRSMRLARGWSQTQLANAIGSSQSHVARIEKGTELIRIDTLRKLCAALEVSIADLNDALERQEAWARENLK